MIKYAKIINDNGLCEVGLGTNEEFYKSIGMVEMDVEISDVNGEWYTTEKCPHKSEEQKKKERKLQFEKDFFNTSLGWIRRNVTMKNGTKDFLSDLLPTISMAVTTGQEVKIIAYEQPPFDKDVEDWTKYQHNEIVTPQFIQECFQQLQADFGVINQ